MISTSRDALLAGKVILEQPRQGYRAAIDPVVLAASLPLKPQQTLLDLGCGVGAAFLVAAFREPTLHVTGLEIQQDLAEIARINILHNQLESRACVVGGDVESSPFSQNSFDHVIANPPYYDENAAPASVHTGKAISHHAEGAALEAWVKTAAYLVKPKGRVSFVLPALRLVEVLSFMTRLLGDITILPVYAKVDRPAERLIISGRKGVKSPFQMLPGIVLHEKDGVWTKEARQILEEGRGFDVRQT